MSQQSLVQLLGPYKGNEIVVLGNTINRRIDPTHYVVIYTANDHIEAINIMHQWRRETNEISKSNN